MTDLRAFLDVSASLSGKFWRGPDPETDRIAQQIAQENELPLPVCAILARLNVTPDAVAGYLSPSLRDMMPDPRSLKDMERAAGRILEAIGAKSSIAIFADYDVDGATSAALLHDYFRALGVACEIYIPDRITEGYGPNVEAMQKLAANHDLIVCVDCGTVSFEPIASVSCDVIVLDHHLGGAELPKAFAVVNPNRADETGDIGHL